MRVALRDAVAFDRQHESVASTGNRCDRLRPHQAPQRRDLHLQVVLLNDYPAPNGVEQFDFRHGSLPLFDEHLQQAESARAERRALAVDAQFLRSLIQFRVAEANDRSQGVGGCALHRVTVYSRDCSAQQ